MQTRDFQQGKFIFKTPLHSLIVITKYNKDFHIYCLVVS